MSHERHGVSYHRQLSCLFHSWFRLTSQKILKSITDFLWWESTGGFHSHRTSNAETVSRPLRHHSTPCRQAFYSPYSKVHGANMGSTWGRQDPGGPHVGPMNFAIWESSLGLHVTKNSSSVKQSFKQLAKNYNTCCQSGFQWTFKQIEPREQFQRRKGFIDLCPWYIFKIWLCFYVSVIKMHLKIAKKGFYRGI